MVCIISITTELSQNCPKQQTKLLPKLGGQQVTVKEGDVQTFRVINALGVRGAQQLNKVLTSWNAGEYLKDPHHEKRTMLEKPKYKANYPVSQNSQS